MSSDKQNQNKKPTFIQKLKGIKHIEIIIGVIAVAIMILIFTSGLFSSNSNPSKSESTTTEPQTAHEWESKLSTVLAGISGVGKTDVMITFSSTPTKITAQSTTTNNNSSNNQSGTTSSTSTTTSPIIVNNNGKSEPYILQEIMPDVIGVIVVAEGAESPVIRLAIMRAVQTVLNVSSTKVEIFPMK